MKKVSCLRALRLYDAGPAGRLCRRRFQQRQCPASSGAAVSTPAVSGDNVLKIGVFEPSTGDSASGGKKEMLGMQYANSETPTVTVGGQEYQIQLVYADNGSSTDKALTAATQLVSEGVSLVLGSTAPACPSPPAPPSATRGCLPSASPAPTPWSPPAMTTISASASWTPSRAPSWPTSPWRSSRPRPPICWARRAMSMTRA